MNTKTLSGSKIGHLAFLALAIAFLGVPQVYAARGERGGSATVAPKGELQTTILYIGADNKVKSLSYEEMSTMKLDALKQLLQEAALKTIPKDPRWRQEATERLDNVITRMNAENKEIDMSISVFRLEPGADVGPMIERQTKNLATMAQRQSRVSALQATKNFIATFGISSPEIRPLLSCGASCDLL